MSTRQQRRIIRPSRVRSRTPNAQPLQDLDALTMRVSVLLTALRGTSHAGAAYGALTALETVLSRYQADECRK